MVFTVNTEQTIYVWGVNVYLKLLYYASIVQSLKVWATVTFAESNKALCDLLNHIKQDKKYVLLDILMRNTKIIKQHMWKEMHNNIKIGVLKKR